MLAYITIFGFIGIGYALSRLSVVPSELVADALNRFAIYLCLPALILLHVPTLEPDFSLLPLVATPWLILLLTLAVIPWVSRVMGWSREVTAVLLVLLPLGNTSFLGFPLVSALYGQEALPFAVIYDQFGSFLMVCTHVLIVVAWFGTGARPTPAGVIGRMTRFPPFLALCVALVFGHDWLNGVWWTLAEGLTYLLLPAVTVAIGLSLKWSLARPMIGPLCFGIASKLVILPAIVFLGLWWLGQWWVWESLVVQVALLEAAMPSMITAAALLSQAQIKPELSNAMVAWTVMLSVLTVPVWHQISLLM
jgi:predicted permease